MGIFIGMAGLPRGGDFEIEVFLQQFEAVEGEENRSLPAQRSGGRGQDQRRIGHVHRALGGDDGQPGHLGRLALGQPFVHAAVEPRFQAGEVGGQGFAVFGLQCGNVHVALLRPCG
jgi:hypothetical protein